MRCLMWCCLGSQAFKSIKRLNYFAGTIFRYGDWLVFFQYSFINDCYGSRHKRFRDIFSSEIFSSVNFSSGFFSSAYFRPHFFVWHFLKCVHIYIRLALFRLFIFSFTLLSSEHFLVRVFFRLYISSFTIFFVFWFFRLRFFSSGYFLFTDIFVSSFFRLTFFVGIFFVRIF